MALVLLNLYKKRFIPCNSVFPGLVTAPYHTVFVAADRKNSGRKILSRNSTFFRNTRFCPSCHRFSLKLRNLIYRKCDVSCKKPYDFRTKFKNIQLNFAQIICIKSFHSFIQVLSLAKQCTACTSISGIYWRKELPIKPFVCVTLQI